ncbi:MAG: hypothetical protein KatS3mg057_0716 [Herpetosiphonaceae bacterium]|nr:MAG: hypothetical protein KatS3mg057_0716 [Herpetosiphonaceae bacterium]
MYSETTINEMIEIVEREEDSLCDRCGRLIAAQVSLWSQPLNDLAAIDIYAVPAPAES